jgi:hypothetical protein
VSEFLVWIDSFWNTCRTLVGDCDLSGVDGDVSQAVADDAATATLVEAASRRIFPPRRA